MKSRENDLFFKFIIAHCLQKTEYRIQNTDIKLARRDNVWLCIVTKVDNEQ